MATIATKKSPVRELAGAGRQIQEDLREKIRGGVYPSGTMLPSQKTLARDYNVAPGTIQRAVKELVEQGILRADSRRGTFVADRFAGDGSHSKPQALRPKIAAIIEFYGPYMDNPTSLAIYEGIYQSVQEKGQDYDLITFNPMRRNWNQLVALERRTLETIENDQIPAVILWHSGSEETVPQLRRLQEKGVALIFLDRSPADMDCDLIGVDNYAGALTAMEHLTELGHRRIAFLTTDEDIFPVNERERGYRDGLKAADLPFDPALIRRMAYMDMGREMVSVVAAFQELANPPTAVFALQDEVARTFIYKARKMGWRVPEDISVVGFDDRDQFAPKPPLLTTIRQPFEQMGRRAVELALQRLTNPRTATQPYQHILLPTRLILRETARPLE